MLKDPQLSARITETYAYTAQMVGQVFGEAPWLINDDDPMGSVRKVHALRHVLIENGIPVPQIADPDADPLGCLIGWRDFLAKLVTVH